MREDPHTPDGLPYYKQHGDQPDSEIYLIEDNSTGALLLIKSTKTRFRFPVLAVLMLALIAITPYGTALAYGHEESGSAMEMGEGSDMAGTDMNESPAMDSMNISNDPGMDGMEMGSTNSWQDQVNKISYPLTALVALFTVWICVMLIRATGLIDKFGLVAAGLVLFLIQSVVGVAYYITDGSIVTMPTLMFVTSLFNMIALLLIGAAFYRWNRMLSS